MKHRLKVKEIIAQQDRSIRAIARATGVNHQNIVLMIAKPTMPIQLNTLAKLARGLNMKPWDLVEFYEDEEVEVA